MTARQRAQERNMQVNKAGLIAGVMVILTLIFAVTPGMGAVAVVCGLLALFALVGSRKG